MLHEVTMMQQSVCVHEQLAQGVHGDDVAGEEQSRELEVVVGKVEADKASLARQVSQMQTDLESRDSHILSLDARLSQRNAQIIELQEDVNHRCEAIARLEKEVREAVTTFFRQLFLSGFLAWRNIRTSMFQLLKIHEWFVPVPHTKKLFIFQSQ